MKKHLDLTGFLLLLILITPQLFVFLYFGNMFWSFGNQKELAFNLFAFGLSISRVAAPLLLLIALVLRRLLQKKNLRWFIFLPLCLLSGYILVGAWNIFIYQSFSWLRALLPLTTCTLITGGYAFVRHTYLHV